MKNKTINALIEMGMPANIKGFHYIVEIMTMFQEDETLIFDKTTALYKKLAEKDNSTASRVERAIRHAFGSVLIKGNMQAVKKYLTHQNTTNGNLLNVLYLKLTQEE